MRKIVLLATVLALAALMMAASPAMADDRNDDGFVVFGDRDCDFHHDCDFDHFGFFDGNGFLASDVDQESESGDVDISFDVSNTGDYAFQCTPAIQFGNTGNFNNGSSLVQFGSGFDNDFDHFDHFGFFGDGFNTSIDDFEPGGIDVTFAPQQAVDCSNSIQQSSAASGGWGGYWY